MPGVVLYSIIEGPSANVFHAQAYQDALKELTVDERFDTKDAARVNLTKEYIYKL